MKLRLLFVATMALAVVATPAKINKTKKKSKAKAEVKETPKVDTVSCKEFSFDMGVAQVNGLKPYLAQRLGVDTVNNMNDFVRGLKEIMEKPSDKALTAYSAGLQIGSQVSKQFLEQLNQQITGEPGKSFIDIEQYKKGFIAALTGESLPISIDSATNVANKQMQYYKEQLMEKKYGANRTAGEAFLAENAKKDSVKSLPSGVQYKILKAGTGEKPLLTSNVKVNYEGRTIDGNIFDSSYKRGKPATFALNQVIKGWGEAITQMPVGSTWEIYIPQELAYGSREAGNIKPFSCLIFKVELLGIEPDKPAAK